MNAYYVRPDAPETETICELACNLDDMTPEEIEAGILKKLRMNGLVNSSLDVIRHLDREIEKESDVIPVALKDGSSRRPGHRWLGESGFRPFPASFPEASGRWETRSFPVSFQ